MSELNEDGNPICPTHNCELYSDGACRVEECEFVDEEVNAQFLEDTDDDVDYDEEDITGENDEYDDLEELD